MKRKFKILIFVFLISLILILISWIAALRMFARLKKTQKNKRREYEKKI